MDMTQWVTLIGAVTALLTAATALIKSLGNSSLLSQHQARLNKLDGGPATRPEKTQP